MLFCTVRNAFRLYKVGHSPPDAAHYSCLKGCVKPVSKGRVLQWWGGQEELGKETAGNSPCTLYKEGPGVCFFFQPSFYVQTAVLPTAAPLCARSSKSSIAEVFLVKTTKPFCYYKNSVKMLSVNDYYYFKFSLSYFKLLCINIK